MTSRAVRRPGGCDPRALQNASNRIVINFWTHTVGLEAQVRDLKAAGCTKIFREQVSSVGEREQLDRDQGRPFGALDYPLVGHREEARSGDDGGCGLRILNLGGEAVDTRRATGRLILTIFAGFAQFERENMLERQREGIRNPQAVGKYLGRKPNAALKAGEAVARVKSGRGMAATAKALGIGRASVYRALEAAGARAGAAAVSTPVP
jgi:hypothetical protein